MPLVLSILITGLVLVGFGVTVLTALSTSMFAGRVPTGPDAMALAGPILAGAVGWSALLVAGWLCVARGGFDWVSPRPMVPLAVVTMVILAVGVGWLWGFWAWAEHWGPGSWACVVAGFLSPLVLQGLLVACAWAGPEELRGAWWTRAAGLSLAPAAACGVAFAAWGVGSHLRATSERVERETAEAAARAAEWDRRERLTEAERTAEDVAGLPPGTPFWNIGCMLTKVTDGEARRLLLERARKVPNFEEDLKGTAECPYPVLRGGAVEFILRSPEREAAWGALVARAMELLAEDIGKAGGLVGGRDDDLAAEVERVTAAAAGYPGVDSSAGLATLRRAVEATPEGERRTRALRAFGGQEAPR